MQLKPYSSNATGDIGDKHTLTTDLIPFLSALEFQMKSPEKFVSKMKKAERRLLKDLMNNNESSRVRMRSHSILLSSNGFSIDEIAKIYEVHRDSVSFWIKRWEKSGIEGLHDNPRSGAPPIIVDSENETVKAIIESTPQSPNKIIATIKKK